MKTILVTGAAGFIGSHFVDFLLKESDYKIIVFDKLTYAGKLANMDSFIDDERVTFVRGDIAKQSDVLNLFKGDDIDYVINFAAESHVDNSISEPSVFIHTNVIGTHNLLNCALNQWKESDDWKLNHKFIQVSTDEVYGMLGESGKFIETNNLNPSSPYSASKASADLICLSYFKTFGFPLIITRSSNNYGPRQDKEKLIPKTIHNALNGLPIPVYGTGKNVRDWIYVKDNCRAIYLLLSNSEHGEVYNIGGDNELTNIDVVNKILYLCDAPAKLISYVNDRQGHDFRYAVDSNKTKSKIGEFLMSTYEDGLIETIKFYKNE